jgi:phosphatidylglycerol---prolipoprotein diacylglyceryl transferase
MITYIVWDVNPEIYTIRLFGTELPVLWYGVLFAVGFLIGQQIVYYIFRNDGKPSGDVDTLTVYVVIGTVIGARVGHFIFYEWEYLLQSPGSWLVTLVVPPYRGLASHGATPGILLAIYLYSRKKTGQSFLWVVDRVVIGVSLGGMFIRLGNLMNSEIYGKVTGLPWGMMFMRETDPAYLPLQPRHPTQIYEAAWCIVILAITFYMWRYKRHNLAEGTIAATFMILLFTFRFFVEFLKNNQVEFENTLVLNMGQVLSIPVVLAGIVILMIANRRKQRVRGG